MPFVQQTPVDFGSLIEIGTLKYHEIDLDETPIIVPACGHIALMITMDRLMGISDHHEVSDSGVPIAFRSKSFPLEVSEVKSCPRCQGSLRNLHRYNRITQRFNIDESTKKFIVRSNMALVPLATRLEQEEQRLLKTKSTIDVATPVTKPRYTPICPTLVRLGGPRGVLLHKISELSGLDTRCGPLLALHHEIHMFLGKLKEDEHHFAGIHRTLTRRSRAMYSATTLQTTNGLLTKALLLRCEYDILSEIVEIHRNQVPKTGIQHHWLTVPLCLDLDFNRRDCNDLIEEAIQKVQPVTEIEARMLFAKFVALERTASIQPEGIEGLLSQACRKLMKAKDIAGNSPILGQPNSSNLELGSQKLEGELRKYFVGEGETKVRCKVLDCTKLFAGEGFWRKHVEDRHPQWYEQTKASVSSNTSSMLAEIEEVEKMVTTSQRQAAYLAMTQDLERAGRWYYCVNMHAFTKAKHEAPVHTLKCPQCGELVAGPPEEVVEEGSGAVDLEHQSRDMVLSAQNDLLEIEM
ncbi:hypothetical protein IMSHALPRED_006018 [Imshaugia aleurites]|uniref:C2H2-type domain-containing protein n=1 Tax=Imshaugia aleurites TaxID=172621 RepID=A0A8H3FHI7_9LECA|nr:hypothetical protein IMSHALPRED_006018 [Imshaugia aleurites]